MSRKERAKQFFMQGYACSQAVLMSFSDVIGIPEEQCAKISLPFGGGMGRQRLTCGCVSSALMVLGMIKGKSEPNQANKIDVYAYTREFCRRFAEKNGSIICEEILKSRALKVEKGGVPEERTDEYYKKRPCAMLVETTVELLENYLTELSLM